MNTMAAPGNTATNTANPHVLEVIRSAEQELTGLLQQRAEITRRMAALKQMLSGVAQLFGCDSAAFGLIAESRAGFSPSK